MRLAALAFTFVAALATTAAAQPRLTEPEASPRARIEQTVGITQIAVDYHRPAIGGRPVWGKLVPYGEVWRAGANENTKVTFSTDVKVGGKPLKAGSYGLHMIPTVRTVTVIFSTVDTAWGSYGYEPKEDALRITVTPVALATTEERLAYRFDDPTNTKTTLTLAWEKLAIPITIEVDTPKQVMANMRRELRGAPSFTWQAWNQAAAYWLANNGPVDEALTFANRSVDRQPTYANLTTQSKLLAKKGKAADAKLALERADKLATEADLNAVGYKLLLEDKKVDEAIAMFRTVTQRFPDSWNAQDSLAEALAMKGDKPGAIASYEKALAMTKDPQQKKRIQTAIAALKK